MTGIVNIDLLQLRAIVLPADTVGQAALAASNALFTAFTSGVVAYDGSLLSDMLHYALVHAEAYVALVKAPPPPGPAAIYAGTFAAGNRMLAALGLSQIGFGALAAMTAALASAAAGVGKDVANDLLVQSGAIVQAANAAGMSTDVPAPGPIVVGDEVALQALITRANAYSAFLRAEAT
jgi:hypothetical protein